MAGARFIIIGAGAIGQTLGEQLLRRADVVFVDPAAHVHKTCAARGWCVIRPGGIPYLARSARDLAIITTKNMIAQQAVDALPADLPALVLSNGMHDVRRETGAGGAAVVHGCVDFASYPDANGIMRIVRPGCVMVPADAPARVGEPLRQALHSSHLRLHVTDDLHGARWSKLIVNCAFDPVSAITGYSYGRCLEHREARRAVQRLLREAIALARTHRITLQKVGGCQPDRLERVLRTPFVGAIAGMIGARQARDVTGVMSIDVRAGVRTELESLNGFICRQAARARIAVPTHQRAVRLVRELEAGRCSPNSALLRRLLHLDAEDASLISASAPPISRAHAARSSRPSPKAMTGL